MPLLIQEKTNWKYIAIAIVLAVLVGGSVLVWIKREEVPLVEIPEVEKPEIVEEEIADWQAYDNEEYGFEIKYPEYGTREENRIDFFSPYIYFETGDITVATRKYLIITDKCILGPISISEEKVQIGEIEFQKSLFAEVAAGTAYNSIVYEPLGESFCFNFVFRHPASLGVFYSEIPLGYDEKYSQWLEEQMKEFEEFTEQILATFRFVDTDEVVDWQTYRNERYGFEAKHPAGWIFLEEECGYQFRIEGKTVIRFNRTLPEKRYICVDVADNKDRLSLGQYFENQKEKWEEKGHVIYFPFVDLKPKREFIVNGHPFYEIWIPGVLGIRAMFASYEDKIFTIYSYEGQEDIFEIQDQMVSTFRFLE